MIVDKEQIRDIAVQYLGATGGVVSALRAIQQELRCVPEEADAIVADVFNLSRAEIRGVVSFYADFSREPKARTVIRLCAAEACQAVGARALQRDIEGKVASGEVAVEPVYCLGLCSAAPAALVGDRLVGRADISRITVALERDETEIAR